MKWLSRFIRHLFATHFQTRKKFQPDVMSRIQHAIAASELRHNGQIRFIVETSLSPLALYHGQSARERAIEVFSLFHVWDTANNNGVLIYLLMADHDFEIIADRNIYSRAGHDYWVKTCQEMEKYLKNDQFEEGVLQGIDRITAVLEEHFPEDVVTPNELSDKPLII
jgi:uncharacterized membrane protein